jgi:hypothetical protein
MNANSTADRALLAQLDRLVAGELPENDRRSLLAWLDEDAARWRSCALAFLEAQTWEAAAGEWPDTAAKSSPNQRGQPVRRASSRVWRRMLAIAAAMALVFVAGRFSARLWPVAGEQPSVVQPPVQPSAAGPLIASVNVRTNLDPHLPARLQMPVTAVAGQSPPPPAISDYERRQWEKRGFELHEELRYLPAKLPDGSDVLVPVNKVQVRLKGKMGS